MTFTPSIYMVILSVHCSIAVLRQPPRRSSLHTPGLRWLSQKKVPGQVKLTAGLDPFQLASNTDYGAATRDLPPVRASDIVSYLVLQTSFYRIQLLLLLQ